MNLSMNIKNLNEIKSENTSIDFDSIKEIPNALTEKVLKESGAGKNVSPIFDSISELIDALHK